MELIKITEQTNGTQTVSARELHTFLEITERFGNWFNRQIQYGFVEDQDYTGCKVFNALANQQLTDYALTIDTAKEIAMIQRSEKGKQARQYFIECEKQLKSQQSKSSQIDLSNPETVLKLAQNWKEEHDRRKAAEHQAQILLEQNTLQEEQLQKQAPKVNYVDKVLTSKTTYPITLIAKELGMTAVKLNKLLHEKGVQYKYCGSWLLYAKYDHKGYTKTKTTMFMGNHGEERTTVQTVWTELGRAFIHSLLKNF